MSRKQVAILIACMALALTVMTILFKSSVLNAETPRFSFERRFVGNGFLQEKKEVDLKYNSFYFAGVANHTFYLGNWTAPFHVVACTLPQLDTQHFAIGVKDLEMPANFKSFRLKIDSPNFYLSHGVLPGIFKGNLASRTGSNFLPVEVPYFVEAVPLSNSLFALRSYSTDDKRYELASLRPDTPYFEFKPNLLQKQIDGVFCEDGTLHFDKQQNKLVYLYAYRNEFFVMDTSLLLLNRFHTLDTFKKAHIKVVQVESKNYSTLGSPPGRTNGLSRVYNNRLYVQSGLLSRHEDKAIFKKACTIDVYNTEDGKYLNSFYLKKRNGVAPSDFIVSDDFVAAIFDKALVTYDLQPLSREVLANGAN